MGHKPDEYLILGPNWTLPFSVNDNVDAFIDIPEFEGGEGGFVLYCVDGMRVCL